MMSSAREEGSRRSHSSLPWVLQSLSNLHPSVAPRVGLVPAGASCCAGVVFGMHYAAPSIRSCLAALVSRIFRWGREIVLVAALAALLGAVAESLQVRRRQAMDVTSEWARYANNPGARGRAFLWLAAQVLPLYLLSKIPGGDEERRRRLLKRSGHILAHGLLKLGPTYVKIGQIASCRDDLLPREWVGELERLQDQVPARHGRDALELAYAAWPGGRAGFHRTFSEFDETPIAAASLGQVHKGTLKATGEPVAIKLQRPHLKEIYEQDMALMSKIAGCVDQMGSWCGKGGASVVGGVSQSWIEIFRDAQTILEREIDYRDESRHIARFCADFGLAKGGAAAPLSEAIAQSKDGVLLPSAASWIRTPIVYEKLSSERVLVMEYVPSIKITDREALVSAKVTPEDSSYLADMLARSYLRQFCCNLFFSTDPHPGNLGVEILDSNAKLSKDRVRLVFYDFGQAATLSQDQAAGILTMMEAIVDTDVNRSIDAFLQMGVLKEGADLEKVRAKVSDNYKTGKIKANRKRLLKKGYVFRDTCPSPTTNDAATTPGVSDAEILQYFALPAEYAFVARALTQLDGVGKSLDSDFDFISSAAPWMFEIKGVAKFLQEEAAKRWNRFVKRVNVRAPPKTPANAPKPPAKQSRSLSRYESFRAVLKRTRTKLFRRKG
jgi:predicted unusual protein kinase regulating ubiquinone biosynthesis (AarF/ABC1/UbiB family)